MSAGKFCHLCRTPYGVDHQFCPEHGERLEEGLRCVAGKFVLQRLLGSGQMGSVYLALQMPMRRNVAVKILKESLVSSEDMVQRFLREAEILSRIVHDNVVALYDCGYVEEPAERLVYLAMEYLSGENLMQLLQREGPLPPERALPLWLGVVSAMAAAHRAGVVHRDLKPENVMVSRRQRQGPGPADRPESWPQGRLEEHIDEVVKVLDFGVAKIIKGTVPAPAQTTPGTVVGTWLYMSPEQLGGREIDARADVFALGVLLVRMLAGRFPWGLAGDESWDAVVLRVSQRPQPLHKLYPGRTFSPELQQLLDEMLDTDPHKRPEDAGALQRRLPQVPEVSGRRAPVIPVPVPLQGRGRASVPEGPRRRGGRVLGRAWLSGLLLVALIIGYLQLRRTPPPRHERAVLLRTPQVAPVRPVIEALPIEKPAVAVPPQAEPEPPREHRGKRRTQKIAEVPKAGRQPEPVPAAPAPALPDAPPDHLKVQFQIRDLGVEVACGKGPSLRPACAGPGSCRVTLSSGERCEAHSNGFKPFRPRTFDFAQLLAGARGGDVRVEL